LTLSSDPVINTPVLSATLPSTAQAGTSVSVNNIVAQITNNGGSPKLSIDWGDGGGAQALS